jgi:amidohydrolase
MDTLWLNAAQALQTKMVKWRRTMHQHPELGHAEAWTSAFVREQLDAMGIAYRYPIGKTGVMAEIGPESAGCTVALRADFDALPIEEENSLEFRSTTPGRAHLCGHDGHTAMLLGAAALLQERSHALGHRVRLFFQHAEEVFPGGARDFVEAGCLEGVSAAYGLHNHPGFPLGTVGVRPGPVMASSGGFRIEVIGKGGHGAAPHLTVDPVVIAAEIVLATQSIVARKTSPFESVVVSFGRVRGGDAFNVIPERVELCGTTRTFSDETNVRIRKQLGDIAEGIARTHGGSVEYVWNCSTPPLVNDEAAAGKVAEAVERIAAGGGQIRVIPGEPTMAAEDFAEIAARVPSCYFFLGTRDEAAGIVEPWHSPRFQFNEAAMPFGAAILASLGAGGGLGQ